MTRIDGNIDSPPRLKVTHKTFGTQNNSAEIIYCRLSMPIEFHSSFNCCTALELVDGFQKRLDSILVLCLVQMYFQKLSFKNV